MSYSAVRLEDLPGKGPGSMVRKVRRALGARAFGFSHFTLPPGGEGREHDHAASGQEEVYVVLAGSGVMCVAVDEVELRPGVVLRVDPEPTRRPVAGDRGLEFMTFGAPLERRYEPPEWG